VELLVRGFLPPPPAFAKGYIRITPKRNRPKFACKEISEVRRQE
jgi:hypothetical protein